MADRAPLLAEDESGGPSAPPPEYSVVDENKPSPAPGAAGQPGNAPAATYQYDELPPPYTPSVMSPQINCKVCQGPISLEGRQHLHVVKCAICNEATPIKAAPAGKKYIRCPCNCLLICKIESTRVACPRENCRRIITINLGPRGPTGLIQPSLRARCAHCDQTIFVPRATATRKLWRCPHCSRTSAVGGEFVRKRFLLFLVIGLIFLLSGVVVTIVTFELAQDSGGIYVVWIGAFVVGILNLIRAFLYRCVKISPLIDQ